MITIKSSCYSLTDISFVINVLDIGLSAVCKNYCVSHPMEEKHCAGCNHKNSCADLCSAYHYMVSKYLRIVGEEDLVDTEGKVIVLPDS